MQGSCCVPKAETTDVSSICAPMIKLRPQVPRIDPPCIHSSEKVSKHRLPEDELSALCQETTQPHPQQSAIKRCQLEYKKRAQPSANQRASMRHRHSHARMRPPRSTIVACDSPFATHLLRLDFESESDAELSPLWRHRRLPLRRALISLVLFTMGRR